MPAGAQQPASEDGFVVADDGTRLHWQTVGEHGDTIVYLHGGPGGQASGRLADLAELARTHVVLGYDQRGGGRSPVADTTVITPDAHVADLDAIRRHFGLERLTLLGHSWGAALAVLYAARHPDHVERIILNGPMPPARVPFEAERAAAMDQAKWNLCAELVGEGGDEAIEACTRRPDLNARIYFRDTTHIARTTGRGGVEPSAFRNTMRVLGDWDFRPAMTRVRAPALVIEGRHTPVPMDQVEIWARTIPNARLLVIDGAGHGYAMIENPGEFFPAVRAFLADVWPIDAASVPAAPQPRLSPSAMIIPASIGSAAGLYLGFLAGLQTGIGGGDDPGLAGGLLFGVAGSALGTALGTWIGSRAEARPATSLAAGTVSILAGVALAVGFGTATGDEGVFIGYALGQGTAAALLTALVENTSR